MALKRNGTFISKIKGYGFEFNYLDNRLIISAFPGSKYENPYSQVIVNLKNFKVKNVRIYSETWASEIGKKLGKQDIQLGSQEFDEKFMIQGEDEQYTIRLLTYTIQDKLLALRKYNPIVNIDKFELIVKVRKVFRKEEEYNLLIEITQLILDKLD